MFFKFTFAILISFLLYFGPTAAWAKTSKCSGKISNVTAVSTDKLLSLKKNYTRGGDFHDILSTNVKTTGNSACLVVHMSTYIQPADNHMVFQVTANGQPMNAHGVRLPGATVNIPAISSPTHNIPSWIREQDPLFDPPKHYGRGRENYQDVPRTVSYTFFKQVKGGSTINIKLRATGCCGAGNNSLIHAATLTVFH